MYRRTKCSYLLFLRGLLAFAPLALGAAGLVFGVGGVYAGLIGLYSVYTVYTVVLLAFVMAFSSFRGFGFILCIRLQTVVYRHIRGITAFYCSHLNHS